MKVEEAISVFNVSDTNGRRNDIVDAYKIYLSILDNLNREGEFNWSAFPKSIDQYLFYCSALEQSKDVFLKHGPFDKFNSLLQNEKLAEAFNNLESKEVIKNLEGGTEFLKLLDQGIEKRARHYTNTLVKIGFCTNERKITNVGNSFLSEQKISRSDFEYLLPINDINIILMRQNFKIKVFDKNYTNSYSPIVLLLFILYKLPRVNSNLTFQLINTINPSYPVDLSDVIKVIEEENVNKFKVKYSDNFIDKLPGNTRILNKSEVIEIMRSNKSNKPEVHELYYKFYRSLYTLVNEKDQQSYDDLKNIFLSKENDKLLKAAFGENTSFLNLKPKGVKEFFEINIGNILLEKEDFNNNFYLKYKSSKRNKDINDYSDMLKRVARSTGIFEITNNMLSLANREIWLEYLAKIDFEELIFQNHNEDEGYYYDNNMGSKFFSNINLDDIFGMDKNDSSVVVDRIKNILNVRDAEEVKRKLLNKNNDLFKELIKTKFPKEKTTQILKMFHGRTHDKEIHEIVGSDANIPTIYEYMVGIAWYHLSEETYDVFSSYNLTMNANLLPETHAGGGQGDIVIDYKTHTLMLEVTLMNKNAQKRGEWEPVLRHATNLTVEKSPRKVRTLFVADELDENTINIWRAVASVPLLSTNGLKQYASNVVIMPLTTLELIKMLESKINESNFLSEIDNSYMIVKEDFDHEWRNKILDNFSYI